MKVIVGISDMKVSKDPGDTLITYSLGSCIGVVVWDEKVKVGGLLHYMLPESSLDPQKAQVKPYMFADSGVPRLFKAAYALGAGKSRMVVKVFGGGQIMDSDGVFNIGKRNYMILRKMFLKNKIIIAREDIGGTVNRTVSLEVGSGVTRLKAGGREEVEV